MMAVIVLPDLAKNPKTIICWECGMLRDIKVVVHYWLEEPINLPPIVDTSPPESLFELVRTQNLKATADQNSNTGGTEVISFDFNTLFAIWETMPQGKPKDNIEANLRKSPLSIKGDGAHEGNQT